MAYFLFRYGVSPPNDETLLFRQKCPKPCSPVCGPPENGKKASHSLPGASAYAPNKMARELTPRCKATFPFKQLSPKGRFEAPAPPHPKAVIPTEKREAQKTNSCISGSSNRTKRISPVISSLTRNLECGRTTDFSRGSK